MRFLWLFWMPLLFLPNLGFGGATAFGELEISDFLIGPFLILVLLASRRVSHEHPRGAWTNISQLSRLLLAFIIWTALSTLLVRERYGYTSYHQTMIGMLKLGKLFLYGFAGIQVSKVLTDKRLWPDFHWALLAAGCVVSLSLVMVGSGQGAGYTLEQRAQGYKASNAIGVMMAMLICYLGGLLIAGWGSYRWRLVAWFALMLMIVGMFLSDGRGGWLAAFVGGLYLFYRRGVSRGMIVGFAAAISMVAFSYQYFEDIRDQIDMTLWPDAEYARHLEQYNAGVAGVDDGARLYSWLNEIAKLPNAPLLGTGFFHRGGHSGLWTTGSHNFFLQMFLETGLVGGLLVLVILLQMWRFAGAVPSRALGQDTPVRSALIVAFIGGLSGEYFYGGMVLFTLLLVFAPVGNLGDPVRLAEAGLVSFHDTMIPARQEP